MKIAILGFGVVGSGTYDVIMKNKESIAKKLNESIDVKYIVDIKDFSGTEYEKIVVSDFSVVELDDEVEVVVEVIGGVGVALEFTKRALLAKKHVVTSNKELVSKFGAELLEIARQNNVNYMFEASVGGGTPIIRPLIQCLAANEIEAITGIVNGTTNYILTEMIDRGLSFEKALKNAQSLGYAESDPSSDINGIDAGRKIAILANLAYSKEVNPSDIAMSGISNIELDDVSYVKKEGYVIKLLARTIKQNGKIFAFVAPHLIKKDHMLAGVSGVFNAIMLTGNCVDDVMFYGKGAGKMATASAVVADIIDAFLYKEKRRPISWEKSERYIANMDDFEGQFYVKIKRTKEIPFDRVIDLSDENKNEVAFITESMKLSELKLKGDYSYIMVL